MEKDLSNKSVPDTPKYSVADDDTELDQEDIWIIGMTRKSAKLTIVIALFFVADNWLPVSSVEEHAQEFIFEGNVLSKVRTDSRTFSVAPEHYSTQYFDNGSVRIDIAPLTRQVRSYALETEGYASLHFPSVGIHGYIYLMYLLLIFSIAQLTVRFSSFHMLALWVFGLGCLLSYTLVFLSSTLSF